MHHLQRFKVIAWFSCILIACAFLSAPGAQANHIDFEASPFCEQAHGELAESALENQDDTHHENHTHGCGSCHLHFDRIVHQSAEMLACEDRVTRNVLAERLSTRPQSGPYRPPSA